MVKIVLWKSPTLMNRLIAFTLTRELRILVKVGELQLIHCFIMQSVKALSYFAILGKLKTLKRTGWVENGKHISFTQLSKKHIHTWWFFMTCTSFCMHQALIYRKASRIICIGRLLQAHYVFICTTITDISSTKCI